ncbi:hypothetical protein LIN78_04435 [Leeia sp. TBRC 13508]|uniref:Uncharacterized protein n=1 Tax=Leeia speluncae TaxID=2884804 RepID=A0ABS8D3N7_9NEIS|nr:hypothetical protein [Leeia speluncae]MCB6182796.1 hypothetical protein [Leeia speluncae]
MNGGHHHGNHQHGHSHSHDHVHAKPAAVPSRFAAWTLLSAPVWQRVLIVLPAIVLLWLGVWWAMGVS